MPNDKYRRLRVKLETILFNFNGVLWCLFQGILKLYCIAYYQCLLILQNPSFDRNMCRSILIGPITYLVLYTYCFIFKILVYHTFARVIIIVNNYVRFSQTHI